MVFCPFSPHPSNRKISNVISNVYHHCTCNLVNFRLASIRKADRRKLPATESTDFCSVIYLAEIYRQTRCYADPAEGVCSPPHAERHTVCNLSRVSRCRLFAKPLTDGLFWIPPVVSAAISACWVSTIPQQGDDFFRSGSPHRNPNEKGGGGRHKPLQRPRGRLPNGFTPAWRTLEWSCLVGATDHTMCVEGGTLDG